VVLSSLLLLSACASAPPPAPAAPTAPTAAPVPATPVAKSTPPAAEPTTGAKAPPLDAVIKEAKAAGTVPLLIFSTVWCGPCELVERDVLPKPEVIKALAPFRLQKYDAEIGEGLVAAQKFGISSYPTIIFLNADGEEVARENTPQRPEPFID